MDKPGPKKAIVLGATGLVGNELLDRLLHSTAYAEVLVFVRRPIPERDKLQQVIVNDWDRLEEHARDFEHAADVFCCLGTTIKKAGTQENFRKVDYDYPLKAARLAKAAGAQRFLIITAMGAKAGSKIFYSRVKGEVEEAIRALRLPSVTIIRPSLLLGKRHEFRLGERSAAWLSKLLGFVFRGSLITCKPIHAGTVASAMYRLAQMYLPGTHIYDNGQLHRLGAMSAESEGGS